MIKYCATAAALKAFSCSRPTRVLYRSLGNYVGGKQRAFGEMPSFYVTRVERTLRLAKRLGLLSDGARVLEVGTGWLHWEAITIGLFFDVSGVLYDVWDNRQMNGLKNYLGQLASVLDRFDVEEFRRSRARALIQTILQQSNYRELYELLGFEYVVDPAGVLDVIEREAFDLVVSAGVLEHVYVGDAPKVVTGIAAVLKPGGWSSHSINIRDHLYQYDRNVSPKQYLHYSDNVWKMCFENDVQYINRLQRSDWLEFFDAAGLSLVEQDSEVVNLSGMKVANVYQRCAEVDLICAGLDIVHRKPHPV